MEMTLTASVKPSTEEIIMETAIELIEQKGYNGVSTKEIAQAAGFSEMTLFRHFGTKQGLLDKAIVYNNYLVDMKEALFDSVTYNLREDLKRVSALYHEYNGRNAKLVLIAFQERHQHPQIGEAVSQNPKQLKQYLIAYLKEMQDRGLVDAGICPETQTMNFLWMNLGYFLSHHIGGRVVAEVDLAHFIEQSVDTFVHALTPCQPGEIKRNL
ncbi:TetR/AcrR family transcriptional regulator [Salisediminibacterium selenitireducens]|uniref:Transcriptional regulator, TetR family n=1 Tax=Bacillus selenitireducens (strain ATCC 700615 / DSM 15326 / MLS10) TaxID=439292 RepID=D6XT67_BACIE|nr:TetR/AcrR family transcriptional regulator [Salisediminibacterium selenitireducens]ADH99003.1 transcriptional regulator, TetR family [[Bacillus] selenitireducens MLS10]